MPPKKKEEGPVVEVVKPDPVALQLQPEISGTEDGEQICIDIMQEVAKRASDLMISNYMDRTAVPYAIQSISEEILHLMQFIFVEKDLGDQTAQQSVDWVPQEEPPAIPVDSWARGAIPIRRKISEENLLTDAEKAIKTAEKALAQPAKKPRPSSARSTGSSSTKSASLRAGGSPKKKSDATLGSTTSPTKSVGGASSVGTGAGNVKKAKKKKPPTEETPAADTPPLVQPLTTTQEAPADGPPTHRLSLTETSAIKKEVVEEESEEMKIERLTQDLKKVGREFYVNTVTGKVFTVRYPDGSKLPTRSLGVVSSIDDKDGEPAAPPPLPTKRRGFMPAAGREKKKKEIKLPPGSFLPGDDDKTAMITDVQPAAGVTVRTGDVTLKASLKPSVDKPSRTEFKRRLEALEMSNQLKAAGTAMSDTAASATTNRKRGSTSGSMLLDSSKDNAKPTESARLAPLGGVSNRSPSIQQELPPGVPVRSARKPT